MNEESFGKLASGQEVSLFTLKNKNGITVKITNFGGIITQILTPDKNHKFEDVVLGFDSLSQYLQPNPYFGAIVGRYGNRIAKGKFKIGSETYNLVLNNNENHLHGGTVGFDKVLWTVEPTKEVNTLVLKYKSRDGEEGYPGNLLVTVKYTLKETNELTIDYQATTDKITPVNLTNHIYFNLSGDCKTDILNQKVSIMASRYLPVDKTLIPTGELADVAPTPFNFINPKPVGQDINVPSEQLKIASGFDHAFIFDEHPESQAVADIFDPISGRIVECVTTEPAVQFYSGNFLDGTITGKKGVKYAKNYGLCLETQHYPDSPNQPKFPNTFLKPGEIYKSSTTYTFLVKGDL